MQKKPGSHFINERFAPPGRPLYLSVHISRIRESTLGRSSSSGLFSWLDNYISVELNSHRSSILFLVVISINRKRCDEKGESTVKE